MTEISSFLSAWTDAERTRDVAFLKANLSDDFVGVGPLGFELPKVAWLARHQAGDLRYDTFDLDEITVRQHGPVAIVIARQTAVGTFQDHPLPQVLRDTLLLTERDGEWQLAGIHLSFVAGTEGAPALSGPPVASDEAAR